MYNFALKEVEEIKGKLKIFKLLVNGTCEYDEFEKDIEFEGCLTSELRTVVTRLHDIADCKSLPETKFKDITPRNENNKEYEIKTHNLRVYLFHEKNTGRIIVCGGKKALKSPTYGTSRKLKTNILSKTHDNQRRIIKNRRILVRNTSEQYLPHGGRIHRKRRN